MRILLIEDDNKISSFASTGLKETGFILDHAAHGEEGLYPAPDMSYDAAVIDLMLPKLDGLTIIEKMRQRGINSPVIILGTKRTVDDRIKELQRGSDGSLTNYAIFAED